MRTTRAPRESQPGRVGAGYRERQARGAATRDARSILANFISPPHIPGGGGSDGGSGGGSDGGGGGNGGSGGGSRRRCRSYSAFNVTLSCTVRCVVRLKEGFVKSHRSRGAVGVVRPYFF